jgi:hypothetical protein
MIKNGFFGSVACPDGFALCEKRERKILTLGHLSGIGRTFGLGYIHGNKLEAGQFFKININDKSHERNMKPFGVA